jgi:hypothetical protein
LMSRFVEGYRLHGNHWSEVVKVVQTRTVTQVRSHAQKVRSDSEVIPPQAVSNPFFPCSTLKN